MSNIPRKDDMLTQDKRLEDRVANLEKFMRAAAGLLTASITYNPPSLAAGEQTITTLNVTGAAMGDTVSAGFSQSLLGIQLTGYVSSAGVVTAVFRNGTIGAIDLASGTLRVDVWKHT